MRDFFFLKKRGLSLQKAQREGEGNRESAKGKGRHGSATYQMGRGENDYCVGKRRKDV